MQTEHPWRYEILDDIGTRDSARVDIAELLWATLVKSGPEGITYKQLDQVPGLSEDIAKKRLPAWYKERRIEKNGSGSKTDPYRWFVPA